MEDIDKESMEELDKESFEISSIDTNMMIMKWKKMKLDPLICITSMCAVGMASLNKIEESGLARVDHVINSSKKLAKLFVENGFLDLEDQKK